MIYRLEVFLIPNVVQVHGAHTDSLVSTIECIYSRIKEIEKAIFTKSKSLFFLSPSMFLKQWCKAFSQMVFFKDSCSKKSMFSGLKKKKYQHRKRK